MDSELIIIECAECGNAFKGRIDQPFLCKNCRENGVKSTKKETSVLNKPALYKEEIEEQSSEIAQENNTTTKIPVVDNNNFTIKEIKQPKNEILEHLSRLEKKSKNIEKLLLDILDKLNSGI